MGILNVLRSVSLLVIRVSRDVSLTSILNIMGIIYKVIIMMARLV